MGIPKFAAWLTRKYPDITSKQCPRVVHGLYIDMNGIIHPCCHSEDDPSVSLRTDAEKIEQVCLCVEHLVKTTRPTTVLYLAMDGVAPRAKMNQQRARRYMSAVDQFGTTFAPEEHGFTPEERSAAQRELDAARKSIDGGVGGLYSTSLAAGHATSAAAPDSPVGMGSPSRSQEQLAAMFPAVEELVHDFKTAQPVRKKHQSAPAAGSFDSNCISPGTSFMTQVSVAVRAFVEAKMFSGEPTWKDLSVVLSDTNSPGEGEHKLIDFLRTQVSYASDAESAFSRHAGSMPPPSVTDDDSGSMKPAHVICGLDADLILLCLSLHTERVVIMRDVRRQTTFGQQPRRRGTPAVDGPHDDDNANPDEGEQAADPLTAASVKKYEYFDVDVIGDSIVSELQALVQATQFRVLAPEAFQNIVSGNGYAFSARQGPPEDYASNRGVKKAWSPCAAAFNHKVIDDFIAMTTMMGNDFVPRVPSVFCGESAMDNLLEVYVRCVLPYGYLTYGRGEVDLKQLWRLFDGYSKIESMLFRRHAVKSGMCGGADAVGQVWSATSDAAWRQLYYDTTTCKKADLPRACAAYVEGMRFVWQYYSCTSEYCSWSWYFPLHHAPFAADIAEFLASRQCDPRTIPAPAVEKDPPSTFAQLLCILPPTSCRLLPACLEDVMWCSVETSQHQYAHLRDTFPTEWAVDYAAASGKEHLSTPLLPFADMKGLQDVVAALAQHFAPSEVARDRNVAGHILLTRGTPALKLRGAEMTPSSSTALVTSAVLRDVASNAMFRPRTYSSTRPVRGFTLTSDGSRPPVRRGRSAKGGSSPAASTKSLRITFGDLTFVAAAATGVTVLLLLPSASASSVTVELIVHFGLRLSLVLMCGMLCLLLIGAASTRAATGCLLSRNNTRDAFVDWLCCECLSLNFMRNDQCFQCRCPADDAASWAVFTGKLPQQPPLFDTNHMPHIIWAQLPLTGELMKQQRRSKEGDDAVLVPTDDVSNCDML